MTNAMLIILYRPVKRCVHTVARGERIKKDFDKHPWCLRCRQLCRELIAVR
jgi:hypothetical protein